ncbi:MAG: hypothetical protein QG567_849, partial [Campylobacterota bacterium]|nr:hypothetical protein [Campylobacterota bacterium]
VLFRSAFIIYDDGLIVEVDSVEILETSKESKPLDGEQIISIADSILFALRFVNKIEIKKLLFKKEKIYVLYKDKIVNITHKDADLNASVAVLDGKLAAEINNLIYKPLKIKGKAKIFFDPYKNKIESVVDINSKLITLNAVMSMDKNQADIKVYKSHFEYEKYKGDISVDAKLDIKHKKLEASGRAKTLGTAFDFNINSNLKKAEVAIYDADLDSIEEIVDNSGLSSTVRVWLLEKIKAKEYRVKYLYIPIDIEKKKPILDELLVEAKLEKVAILFNEKLKRAKSSEVLLEMADSKLSFYTNDANYEDVQIDLSGSIDNLFSEPVLNINIASDTNINETLKEVLGGYDIPLDFLKQEDGKNSSVFGLKLGLAKDLFSISVSTALEDSKFKIFDNEIISRGGKVALKDKEVEIDNLNIAFKNMIDLNLTGMVDIKEKQVSAKTHISSLDIGNKEILDIKNISADLNISYKDAVLINSKELHTNIVYEKDKIDIKVDDLTLFVKNSPILQMLEIQNGKLNFIKYDGNTSARASIDSNGTSIFQNGKKITKFDIAFDKSGNKSRVVVNKDIVVDIKNSEISIDYKNIDISLSSLLAKYGKSSEERELVEKKYEEKKKEDSLAIKLFARNSNIFYEERVIPADDYNLFLKDDFLNFELNHGITKINVYKESDEISITAKKIDSEFTKKLFKFEMKNGKADLLTSGNIKTKEFYGVLSIKDATVKGFALINNIIAFINTVPSLVTLKNPGFDSDGYTVKNGTIEYFTSGDMIYLSTIRFIGNNTDIIGYGQVNLKTKEVDLTLSLNTIKGLSNLIGKIPLVGYVLLGDEKTIGTLISVKGPLDNPEVKTTFAQNAALYPFSVIKRTVLWPFKLFEDEDEK